jgi:hypothetical protein
MKVAQQPDEPPPKSYVAPMPCDRRQNACWHLRCNNPSEGKFLWVFSLERMEVRCLKEGAGGPWHGVVQRYAARAVFRCDAEVIPTAGRTHRFGSGILEFFRV